MISRAITAILALIAWLGLIVQFVVICGNLKPDENILSAIGTFLSYFTVLSNLIAAIVLTICAVRSPTSILAASISAATVVYIIVVGAVYFFTLRNLWDPSGLQWLANAITHYVIPIGYPITWVIAFPKRRLLWRHLWFWMIYPFTFAVISTVRGHVTGWYPYPFLDADVLGDPRVLLNILVLTAGFAALGAVILWLNRTAAARSSTVS
jgi:hypothetical protein